MDRKYDFSGWATRNDLVCADGRTIKKDAFKHCDGATVPLVWNHKHDEPANILGHALLENRTDGVYAYCSFNSTEAGQAAKELVQHGDIASLSIYANGLKHEAGREVIHGDIKELSLVIAGANPGAFIDFVDMAHGDDGNPTEVILSAYEPLSISHSAEKPPLIHKDPEPKPEDKPKEEPKDDPKPAEQPPKEEPDKQDKTVEEVIETMNDDQKAACMALVAAALESKDEDEDDDDPDKNSDKTKGGDNTMKHNLFVKEEPKNTVRLRHAQGEILNMAKTNSVGTLQNAIGIYMEQNEELMHGIDNIEALFPDFQDVRPGAPELVTRDQGWVSVVIKKVHKSPISRIRTRQMDARLDTIRGHGYVKGSRKAAGGNMALISRTTDPQTVYIIDALNRDDIIDIKDFDVVEYQYGIMRQTLNEELATSIMIGDGRNPGDDHKISEDHIRSIWNDNETYTLHKDVDIEAAKAELQGTNTGANFGDNYVYAEAIVTAALYAREDYKGTGTPDFFCTPHLVNVMMLARDLNGRRIYSSKNDLIAALNIGELHTAEQFDGLVRTDGNGKKHRLLGIFVNLADYTVGSTKGGEIARFEQFDIDFNQNKYLIETRLSGALTRIASAIALEEPVNP